MDFFFVYYFFLGGGGGVIVGRFHFPSFNPALPNCGKVENKQKKKERSLPFYFVKRKEALQYTAGLNR